ncbi:hypothetical protein ACFOPQ_14645 [Deinococcus antarcticus]|uniref:Uncharacterized protein n=1 Tax=Deinococcus antarcticus TaxID=1298767 RepID=A0ABV8A9J9_9DEIO
MIRDLNLWAMLGLLAAAALMILSLFLLWWSMKFYAPQYPEGLDIIVYPNKLAGDIDIVNGLNHYIGMAPFSEASFPELKILPIVVIVLALMMAAAAFLRSSRMVWITLATFAVVGVGGLWDMARWLRKFGTNLDPQAPIQLDPFVPPIFGKNTIANFTTYSNFQIGAFVLLIVGVLLLLALTLRDRPVEYEEVEEEIEVTPA